MAKDIKDLDRNFTVGTKLNKDNIKFYNADDEPFKIYGVYRDGDIYVRMPWSVAKTVNEQVEAFYGHTTGGRIRFKTDSSYVAISTVLDKPIKLPHMTWVAGMGYDLYADNIYIRSFIPYEGSDEYEAIIELGSNEMREITINMPLYSGVSQVYIGLEESAKIEVPTPYRNDKPVVYYGSSITHGGCASRPGMCYENIISRRLNIDFINLGFSSGAKGEDTMADYIKSLDMSVFVYDYDHNAPTVEHLKETHERMFLKIREAHPDIPVIMMSRPQYYYDDNIVQRREVIETTYKNALARGDKNVYFLDGKALMALCRKEGTVDGCHPTDFGFNSMAQAVGDVMEKHNLV